MIPVLIYLILVLEVGFYSRVTHKGSGGLMIWNRTMMGTRTLVVLTMIVNVVVFAMIVSVVVGNIWGVAVIEAWGSMWEVAAIEVWGSNA